MKKEIQKDIFGIIPEAGDIIVYNPPKYKGLVYGICVGFSSSSGLPIILINEKFKGRYLGEEYYNKWSRSIKYIPDCYTPKSEFIISRYIKL